MLKVIQQSVTLPASARTLYGQYLSSRAHGEITGHKVIISSKPGSRFSAFGGALSGRMLYTIPGRLIVQSWRSTPFRATDADSTLILLFVPAGAKARIDLTHVNVPTHDFKGVTEGWKSYYWKPWRRYLDSARK